MALLVRNGINFPERVLHVNKQSLHPGIAVVNVLKILAENDPAICHRDWGMIVLPAKVNAQFTTITISGVNYPLRQNFLPRRITGIERCLYNSPRKGHKYEESFFILNPHPQNTTLDRLVVKCEHNRKSLADLVPEINAYCAKSPLPYLQGIQII